MHQLKPARFAFPSDSDPSFIQQGHSKPNFTDEEVLTIYLFGLIKKRETIREIYDYTCDHFLGWFPDLPPFKSYNRRLNRLHAVFAPLAREALAEVDCNKTQEEAVRIAGRAHC